MAHAQWNARSNAFANARRGGGPASAAASAASAAAGGGGEARAGAGVERHLLGRRESEGEETLHYLDVFLRKHNPMMDFKLMGEELEKLVFRDLQIPAENLVGVDQGDLRYVEICVNVDPEPWRNFGTIWVRDGLTTSGVMLAREQMVHITLHGAPLKVSNREIKEVFSAFGDQIMDMDKKKPRPSSGPDSMLGLCKWTTPVPCLLRES